LDKVRHPKVNQDMNKINLICHLLVNYGAFLESYEGVKESYDIFKSGLEFSLSLLGELSVYTSIFKDKLKNPIYQHLKKDYSKYASIGDSEYCDSSNVSVITKSLDGEDLLSRYLKKRSTKKVTIRQSRDNSPNNTPKPEIIKIDKMDKNLEDSLVSGITNTENSEIKADDNKSFSMDNCQIEIKTVEAENLNTIIENESEMSVIKKTNLTDNKSSTIENTKKPSRLKQLFSMVTTSSSTKLGSLNKRNSIRETPKIKSLFDKKLSFLKKKSTMLTEPSMYHEVMTTIDNNEIPLAQEDVPVISIDQSVRRQSYQNFVTKLSEQSNFKRLTGKELPSVVKINSNFKTSDDYIAEPYYAEDQRPELKGKKVERKDFLKYNFGRQLLMGRNIFYHITNEIDYKFFDEENNGNYALIQAYKYRIMDDFDTFIYIKELVGDYKIGKVNFSIQRRLGNTSLKIIVTYETNSNNIKGFLIRLYSPDNTTPKNELFVSLDRLPGYFKRMNYNHALNKDMHIKYINSLEVLLERVFIHHCYPYISDNVYHVGVLSRPVGVFCNESYSFHFLKAHCSIEFNILENKNVNLLIFSRDNDTNYIQIDVITDENSFKQIFGILEQIQFYTIEGEKQVKHYKLANNKHLNKNGLIPMMLLRIQEILKFKFNNAELKFEDLVIKNKDMILKLQIENDLTTLDFYILQYVSEFKWTVEYYALKKLEGILVLILVNPSNSFYIQKALDLNEEDFINVFGCHPRDILYLLDERERIMINSLLLNTIKLRSINSQGIVL
jgi:hypothetical protein